MTLAQFFLFHCLVTLILNLHHTCMFLFVVQNVFYKEKEKPQKFQQNSTSVNQLLCEIHYYILVAIFSKHKLDVSCLITVFTKTLQTNRPVGPMVCQNILNLNKFSCPHISICVTLKVHWASVKHNSCMITNCFRHLTFKIYTGMYKPISTSQFLNFTEPPHPTTKFTGCGLWTTEFL